MGKRRQPMAEELGLGGKVHAQRPTTAGQGKSGCLGPERGRPPDDLAQRGRPTQMDVGVVLPREAHAPEELDGSFGRLDVAIESQ